MANEILSLFANLLNLVIGVMLIVAILRIFTISALLKNILNAIERVEKKVACADRNRREEFNALSQQAD